MKKSVHKTIVKKCDKKVMSYIIRGIDVSKTYTITKKVPKPDENSIRF